MKYFEYKRQIGTRQEEVTDIAVCIYDNKTLYRGMKVKINKFSFTACVGVWRNKYF